MPLPVVCLTLFDWFLLCCADKPVMDDSPQLMKAAGDEGQLAKLVCRSQGAPNISFGWSREGTPLTPNEKYSLSTRQIDIVTWESTLEVSNVRSLDYGLYDCVARNELGTNTAKVILSGTSRPDPPLALHVVNVTHDSAHLTWRSGFDGGLFQNYRLRFRQVSTKTTVYHLFAINLFSFCCFDFSEFDRSATNFINTLMCTRPI